MQSAARPQNLDNSSCLSKYGTFRVGKDPRTCQLFGTSWAFGKTPGAPPLQIKGLRIDKETLADSMCPEQEGA